MAYYLVRARARRKLLPELELGLREGAFLGLQPFGRALSAGLRNARTAEDGFAIWEEIPLYHATPLIFARTMERGIPQQMLREMALRDMNRPSVLFHGFANESTGEQERTDALRELHEVDRAIDGSRLTGQVAYGPTSRSTSPASPSTTASSTARIRPPTPVRPCSGRVTPTRASRS